MAKVEEKSGKIAEKVDLSQSQGFEMTKNSSKGIFDFKTMTAKWQKNSFFLLVDHSTAELAF
jgi:hypothetical protein